VAHPRAAEALNRKDGMPATVKESAAVGPDERAVGDVQADVASYGILCSTRKVAEDVPWHGVAHLINAVEVPARRAVGIERGMNSERAD